MRDQEKKCALTAGAQVSNDEGITALLNGIAAIPRLLALLEAQGRDIANLRTAITATARQHEPKSGWLDAAGAAAYLSMSPGTFDKYRYQTSPKIKGYKVGGKVLYKPADLDSFVMLFELKSSGLA